VNTTVSDFRVGVAGTTNTNLIDHYAAVIKTTADYGVWGDELVGRGDKEKDFRFGFNGMEKDDDIKGDGNSYDFGARIYDPRLGRWLSLDKRMNDLPFATPYNYVLNNPNLFFDPDGNFLISVHERIIENAFKAAISIIQWFKNPYYPDANVLPTKLFHDGLVSGVGSPDRQSLLSDKFVTTFTQDVHSDNKNRSNMKGAWGRIKEREDAVFEHKWDAYALGFKLGRILHTVQDFYSHSNYVKLYSSFYKTENVKDFKLYEDAIKDGKFAAYLENNLKTGTYHTHASPGKGEGFPRRNELGSR
jgi:RHS repeat-associated protein